MALTKFFKIPTPKDLGYSDSLPVSWLNKSNQYSWEIYEKEISYRFPFRYFFYSFINRKIIDNLLGLLKVIKRSSYYLLSRFYYKDHIVNLTQPKNSSIEYTYGHLDFDTKIKITMFTLLVSFVEKELLPAYGDEPITESFFVEALEIYNWWKKERQEALSKPFDLTDPVGRAMSRNNQNKVLEKDKKMLKRLIILSPDLWV